MQNPNTADSAKGSSMHRHGDLAMILGYWTQTNVSESFEGSRRFRRSNDTFS